MRLWVGIALTGVVLLTLAASFAGSASADERDAERGADRTAEPTPTPTQPSTPTASPGGEAADDAEEQRVARWRIVDQPTTRWEGRGSERLARTGAATSGEVFPVLPLGAGLTCVGLGIGLFGYRLRRG